MPERLSDIASDSPELLEKSSTFLEKMDALFVSVITQNTDKKERLNNRLRFRYSNGIDKRVEQVTVLNLIDENRYVIWRPFIDASEDESSRTSALYDNRGGLLYTVIAEDLYSRSLEILNNDGTSTLVKKRCYEIFADGIRTWSLATDRTYETEDIAIGDERHTVLLQKIEQNIGINEIIEDYETKIEPIGLTPL